MEIVPQAETVLQLQDNWYLVHSPHSFTSYITCLNASSSEIFIKHGGNRNFVSPSCQLQLQDHVLISAFSVHLDAVFKHNAWELDRIAFSADKQVQSVKWLAVRGDENLGKSTLTSIHQYLTIEHRSPVWL
jgi:hypothetical protein